MRQTSVEGMVEALQAHGVRYLIAGGLAVVAHGYVRFTADVDLVLDPDPENLERAVAALAGLGYAPRAPVPFRDFVAAENRARWAAEKGMLVFTVRREADPETEIDLFLEPPLPFAEAYRRAARFELRPGLAATFVGFADLLRLKRAAGRPLDLEDVRRLRQIRGEIADE